MVPIIVIMPAAVMPTATVPVAPMAPTVVIVCRCSQRHSQHGGNCQTHQYTTAWYTLAHDAPPLVSASMLSSTRLISTEGFLSFCDTVPTVDVRHTSSCTAVSFAHALAAIFLKGRRVIAWH
jgi:hypothetical protein